MQKYRNACILETFKTFMQKVYFEKKCKTGFFHFLSVLFFWLVRVDYTSVSIDGEFSDVFTIQENIKVKEGQIYRYFHCINWKSLLMHELFIHLLNLQNLYCIWTLLQGLGTEQQMKHRPQWSGKRKQAKNKQMDKIYLNRRASTVADG